MYLKKQTASVHDVLFDLNKICDDLFYAPTQQAISDLEDHKDKFSNEIEQLKLIEKELNNLGEAVSNIIDNIKRKIKEDNTIASIDDFYSEPLSKQLKTIPEESLKAFDDILENDDIHCCSKMWEAIEFVREADGGDHYGSREDILNMLGYSGDEKNVCIIDKDLETIEIFDNKHEMYAWALDQLMEHDGYALSEIKEIMHKLK